MPTEAAADVAGWFYYLRRFNSNLPHKFVLVVCHQRANMLAVLAAHGLEAHCDASTENFLFVLTFEQAKQCVEHVLGVVGTRYSTDMRQRPPGKTECVVYRFFENNLFTWHSYAAVEIAD
jgi:hypothetical protein